MATPRPCLRNLFFHPKMQTPKVVGSLSPSIPHSQLYDGCRRCWILSVDSASASKMSRMTTTTTSTRTNKPGNILTNQFSPDKPETVKADFGLRLRNFAPFASLICGLGGTLFPIVKDILSDLSCSGAAMLINNDSQYFFVVSTFLYYLRCKQFNMFSNTAA